MEINLWVSSNALSLMTEELLAFQEIFIFIELD
jgi:hypothetical protein